MRAILTALALLLLLAVGWWSLQDGGAAPAPPDPGPREAPTTRGEPAGDPGSATAPPAPVQRTPALRQPKDLADHPTAWLEVRDAATDRVVPGAAVYRLDQQADVAAIAYSDHEGRAGVPLRKAEQLIVVVAGYLLRLAPTQPGSTPQLPQIVRLEPDRYSHRCLFRFVLPDGGRPDEVRVRFKPSAPEGRSRELPLPAAVVGKPEAIQRAWREQLMIAALKPVPEVRVQLGHRNAAVVHVCAADDEVSFAVGGLFELEASTPSGFAARATFDVATITAAPFVVRLLPGRSLAGVVRDAASGAPVPSAQVALVGGEPLQLVAATDANGRFTLAPLADGMVGIEVRHRDYEVGHAGPVAAGTQDASVQLVALPVESLRGRVRGRPRLEPLAGAKVSLLDALGQPVLVGTDADGTFVIRASGKETIRLNISMSGYVPWSELIDPGAPAYDFDLWPNDTDVRLAASITGMLRGVVVDDQGRPVAGAQVRLLPGQPPPFAGLGSRRVLGGGALLLPLVATSGTDGSFALETQYAGPGALLIGDAGAGGRLAVTVVLGKTVADLRVVARM